MLSAGSVCSHKKVNTKIQNYGFGYRIKSLSDCKAFCEGNGASSLAYRKSGLVIGEFNCACCEESFHLTTCAGCSVHTLGITYSYASFTYILFYVL